MNCGERHCRNSVRRRTKGSKRCSLARFRDGLWESGKGGEPDVQRWSVCGGRWCWCGLLVDSPYTPPARSGPRQSSLSLCFGKEMHCFRPRKPAFPCGAADFAVLPDKGRCRAILEGESVGDVPEVVKGVLLRRDASRVGVAAVARVELAAEEVDSEDAEDQQACPEPGGSACCYWNG